MDDAILVFDDDCGFCTWWARFVRERSDLRLVGFSALEAEHEDLLTRLPEDYRRCSHLVTEDAVYSCGASMEEALVRSEVVVGLDLSGPVDFFRHFEDYNRTRESVYRWVAEHRGLLGHLMSADTALRQDEPEA